MSWLKITLWGLVCCINSVIVCETQKFEMGVLKNFPRGRFKPSLIIVIVSKPSQHLQPTSNIERRHFERIPTPAVQQFKWSFKRRCWTSCFKTCSFVLFYQARNTWGLYSWHLKQNSEPLCTKQVLTPRVKQAYFSCSPYICILKNRKPSKSLQDQFARAQGSEVTMVQARGNYLTRILALVHPLGKFIGFFLTRSHHPWSPSILWFKENLSY